MNGIIAAMSRQNIVEKLSKKNLKNTLLVDTFKGAPLNMNIFSKLNPYFVWEHSLIPVPGMKNYFSRSIEAVWQGTKIINDAIDEKQFHNFPYKRPPESERLKNPDYSYKDAIFFYEGRSISINKARYLIYLVSYLYLLNYIIPKEDINYLKSMSESGKNVVFYDWDSNFDINNVSLSFSHSAILASWFRGSLEKDFLQKAKVTLKPSEYFLFFDVFHNSTTQYRKLHQL